MNKPHIKLHSNGSVSIINLKDIKDHKPTNWFLKRWYSEIIKQIILNKPQFPKLPKY
jgi:hypothetical protein